MARRKHKKHKKYRQCGGWMCRNESVVHLTAMYHGEQRTFNCCARCWADGLAAGIRYYDITPVV